MQRVYSEQCPVQSDWLILITGPLSYLTPGETNFVFECGLFHEEIKLVSLSGHVHVYNMHMDID